MMKSNLSGPNYKSCLTGKYIVPVINSDTSGTTVTVRRRCISPKRNESSQNNWQLKNILLLCTKIYFSKRKLLMRILSIPPQIPQNRFHFLRRSPVIRNFFFHISSPYLWNCLIGWIFPMIEIQNFPNN